MTKRASGDTVQDIDIRLSRGLRARRYRLTAIPDGGWMVIFDYEDQPPFIHNVTSQELAGAYREVIELEVKAALHDGWMPFRVGGTA